MLKGLKVWIPVLVVFAVLVGGYFITQALRDDGPSAASKSEDAARATAEKEESDATRTPTAQRTRTPRPTASSAEAVTRDLERDEDRGGHTLERHVGKSDAELLARLKREPDIAAASTYTDQATAERTVGAILAKNEKKVSDWAAEGNTRPNLVLRATQKETIGRSIRQGQTKAKDVTAAVVVLRADGRGWFVLTSYPEEAR